MGFQYRRYDNTHIPEFTASDIKMEALIERLGGRDLLSLMINAESFKSIYHPDQGLSFIYKVSDNDCLHKVQFIPNAYSSTSDSFYTPLTYQIRMIVEELRGLSSFTTAKPYHTVNIQRPETLVRTFEVTAKVTLSF